MSRFSLASEAGRYKSASNIRLSSRLGEAELHFECRHIVSSHEFLRPAAFLASALAVLETGLYEISTTRRRSCRREDFEDAQHVATAMRRSLRFEPVHRARPRVNT